jgi:hypothetical protein
MIGGSSRERGWEFFSSPPRPDWLWGPSYRWVPGALSLGVKRPAREADHLPPSNAGVKNAWATAPISSYQVRRACRSHIQYLWSVSCEVIDFSFVGFRFQMKNYRTYHTPWSYL